jgi:hypothetical protein
MARRLDADRIVEEDGVVRYTREGRSPRKAPSAQGRKLSDEQIDDLAPISEDDLSNALGGVSIRNLNAGKTLGQRKRRSLGSPRSLDALLRRAKALELRRAGFTWQEIADRKSLGYTTPRHVQRDVMRLLSQLIDQPAQEVIALELSRLDAITQALWQNVRNGDLPATDRLFMAMRMRQELLGLHKINIEHSVVTVSDLDREIARLTVEMSELDAKAKGRDEGGTSISDRQELEEAQRAAGL